MNCKLKHQGFVDFIRDTFIGISEILRVVIFIATLDLSQPPFICSKPTMKTPEQCVKTVRS